MSGGSDENDSRMDTVLAPLRDLVRASGAACVLLHHAPKQGDEYRGSTAIGAAVELGFTLASPGEGDAKRLRCWKCRPAAKQPDRWLAIRERPDGPEFVRADAPTPADTGMADLTDMINTGGKEFLRFSASAKSKTDDKWRRFRVTREELPHVILETLVGIEPEVLTDEEAQVEGGDDDED
jgi:hypothetical protein